MERRRSTRLAQKQEQGDEDAKPTCHITTTSIFITNHQNSLMAPQALSTTPTRCSKRLLEARVIQSRSTEITNPPAKDFPSKEEVTTYAETVTQVPHPLNAPLLSYSRTRKTGQLLSAKRGKLIEENNNYDGKVTPNFCTISELKQIQVENHSAAVPPPSAQDEVSLITQALSGEGMALTEIAAMAMNNSLDDSEDEIDSSFDPALVTVGNYRVKKEYASLLRSIFNKYGDIGKDCIFKSPKSCSLFLEMICTIFLRLEGSTFEKITSVDIKHMLDQVADMKAMGLKVDWLWKKLDEINEVKFKVHESLVIKGAKTGIRGEIEKVESEMRMEELMLAAMEEEVAILQGKIRKLQTQIEPRRNNFSSLEEKLAELKEEEKEICASALNTMAKVNAIFKKSLVHGLL